MEYTYHVSDGSFPVLDPFPLAQTLGIQGLQSCDDWANVRMSSRLSLLCMLTSTGLCPLLLGVS